MEVKIKKIVADILGCKWQDVMDTMFLDKDLGADDLDIIEIIMTIERDFNINILDKYIDTARTVKDLIKIVDSCKKHSPKIKDKKTVKKRVIKFTEYTYDDGSVALRPITKGFNDFELLGILSYFEDVFEVKMMQLNNK
jgi:acyl carrier protein